MKRDSVPVLVARGFASALACWKALLLCLALNALLAFAVTHPIATALHQTFDDNPAAARLLASVDVTVFDHFTRQRPDVLGNLGAWETIATGEASEPGGRAAFSPNPGLRHASGASGSLLVLGLANALLASFLTGGFAGRFGAEQDRGSLPLFGQDVGRLGPASFLLGILSLAGIAAAYRWIWIGTGALYRPEELRYEWEAVGLGLLRLLAFLLVAALFRMVVVYARAGMGLSGKANPVMALFSAAGFVAGRPGRALVLEVAFGAAGVLPLVLWALLGATWDGRDPARLALLVGLQQLVVFIRITARTAYLGSASAFLRRGSEAPRAVPASGAAVIVSEPAS